MMCIIKYMNNMNNMNNVININQYDFVIVYIYIYKKLIKIISKLQI